MTSAERTALLNVAARQDRREILVAQKESRAALKINARFDRKELEQERKQEMRHIRDLQRAVKDHFDARKKELSQSLKDSIAKSDADIVRGFAEQREAQADKRILAMAIADHDLNNNQRSDS